MKIDLTTILGLVVALGGIFAGYYMEGGSVGALIAPSPLLIIFGGTFGVVIITQPGSSLKQIGGIMKSVFTDKKYDFLNLIDTLCELARVSQREGSMVLEEKAKDIDEPFLKRALISVAGGNDPETVKDFMETDVSMMEQRHSNNQKMFSAAGGFSPTMGIIGTVLGLVVILGKLGGADIGELGHGIATAFLATFMGVASANLVFLPFEAKLKMKTNQEVLYREIVIQGVVAIISQESHLVLRQRLLNFLPDNVRAKSEKKKEEAKKKEGE